MHRSDVLQRCLSRVATIWRRDLDIDEKIEPRSAAAAAALQQCRCRVCGVRHVVKRGWSNVAWQRRTVRREGRTLPSLSRRHKCSDRLHLYRHFTEQPLSAGTEQVNV